MSPFTKLSKFWKSSSISRRCPLRINPCFLLLIPASLALTACGPSQSSHNKEKAQIEADRDQDLATEEAKYSPLEGTYEGTLTTNQRQTYNCILYLHPIKILINNQGESQNTEIPSIGGSIMLYTPPQNKSTAEPVGFFSSGKYDPQTGSLHLYYSAPSSVGGVVVPTSFVGKFKNETISGYYYALLRESYINVRRVR